MNKKKNWKDFYYVPARIVQENLKPEYIFVPSH
jgi:hypothetical protein